MKIWLLTTEYPPYFGGGIATYAGIITPEWARLGHEVPLNLPTVKAGGS
ncbi:MAG: hypothetical protein OWQ57_12440 [Sulfobacillus sp.]|nr:hypothetical protein [Sulfobacillus sp.]